MRENESEMVFALLRTASYLERKLDRALSSTKGVSFTEFQILNELHITYNGAATRVDLASAVRLTPSAITRALKPLEKIGLVETIKSERDARRSIAQLTETGKVTLEDAQKIVDDEIASMSIATDHHVDFMATLKSIHA